MNYGIIIQTLSGESETIRLRMGSNTLGSDASNSVVLDDETIAARHARIICTTDRVLLSDMGSRNGTYLNQKQLPPNTPQPLHDGDEIMLGRVPLRFVVLRSVVVPPPPGGNGQDAGPGAEQPPGERPAPGDGQAGQPARTTTESGAPPSVGASIREITGAPPPEMAVQRPPVTGSRHVPARRIRGNRRAGWMAPGQRQPRQDAEDYVALLPPIYHGDPFVHNFLGIFKSILEPLDRMISHIYYYFDPRLAPEHLLPWLATWVDLVLNENWPIERRRELIRFAAELYRTRGTRRGMNRYLRIYSGVEPQIIEPGQERPGEAALAPHTFRVIIETPDPSQLDRALIEQIILAEKPAHTAYLLDIRPTPAR